MQFQKGLLLLVSYYLITDLYSQQTDVEMENVIITANQSAQQQKESGRAHGDENDGSYHQYHQE